MVDTLSKTILFKNITWWLIKIKSVVSKADCRARKRDWNFKIKIGIIKTIAERLNIHYGAIVRIN